MDNYDKLTAYKVKEFLKSYNKYPINDDNGKRLYPNAFYNEFTSILEQANKKWRKAKRKGFTGTFEEYLTPSTPPTD